MNTATTKATETTTYTITGSDHDIGAKPISIVRPNAERAASSAKLMGECGYRAVTVTAA